MAFDIYTKALLHFNGTDGSTTAIDEIGKTWTSHGGFQLDTAQYKFGESSGYFIPSGYIDTPDHSDWVLGTSDFTIEAWVNVGIGSFQTICRRSISYWVYIESSGSLVVKYYDAGSGGDEFVTGGTVANNTWTHVAVVMATGNMTIYINGVGNSPTSTGGVVNSAGSLLIGDTTSTLGGWLDEFRFSNIARWTSNFNPPTAPYGSVSFMPQVMIIGE